MNKCKNIKYKILCLFIAVNLACSYGIVSASNYGNIGLLSKVKTLSYATGETENFIIYENDFSTSGDVVDFNNFIKFQNSIFKNGDIISDGGNYFGANDQTALCEFDIPVNNVSVGDCVQLSIDIKMDKTNGAGSTVNLVTAANSTELDNVEKRRVGSKWIQGKLSDGILSNYYEELTIGENQVFDKSGTPASNGTSYIHFRINSSANQASKADFGIDNIKLTFKDKEVIYSYRNKINREEQVEYLNCFNNNNIIFDVNSSSLQVAEKNNIIKISLDNVKPSDRIILSFDGKAMPGTGVKLFAAKDFDIFDEEDADTYLSYYGAIEPNDISISDLFDIYDVDAFANGEYGNISCDFLMEEKAVAKGYKTNLFMIIDCQEGCFAQIDNISVTKEPGQDEGMEPEDISSLESLCGSAIEIHTEIYSIENGTFDGYVIAALYNSDNTIMEKSATSFSVDGDVETVVNNIFIPQDATNDWDLKVFAWNGFDEDIIYSLHNNLFDSNSIVNGSFEVTDINRSVIPSSPTAKEGNFAKVAYGLGMVEKGVARTGLYSLKCETVTSSNGKGVKLGLIDKIQNEGTYKLSYWYKVDADSCNLVLINKIYGTTNIWKNIDLTNAVSDWKQNEIIFKITQNDDGSFDVTINPTDANAKIITDMNKLEVDVNAGANTADGILYLDDFSFEKID